MYKIFGCKVNKFYINQRLAAYGEQEDTFLIATCVVTDRAKNKWLKQAEKALKSGMKVAITGCGTLEKGKLIAEADFYALYPELREYRERVILLGEAPSSSKIVNNEDSSLRSQNPPYPLPQFGRDRLLGKGAYTKHFVLIQNGCDNHCSFCLTVMKRGPHWSRPLEEIIDEIKQIEAAGGKEIVLTGVNLMARGATNTRNPKESRFVELLETILEKTTLPRIRISSIGPEYANDHFFEVVQDERILPHFHYSIQSFSDKVLRLMGRNYTAEVLDNVLTKTRNLQRVHPNHISLGADIIVGFPGESESDFLETLEGIEKYGITKLHAFPFSDHHKGESVPASFFPDQVEQAIKKERESRLLAVGEQVRSAFIEKNKGMRHEVLIEERKNGQWKGRTENYIQVALEGEYKKGEIVHITL